MEYSEKIDVSRRADGSHISMAAQHCTKALEEQLGLKGDVTVSGFFQTGMLDFEASAKVWVLLPDGEKVELDALITRSSSFFTLNGRPVISAKDLAKPRSGG